MKIGLPRTLFSHQAGVFCELRVYGVLRSSLRASNPKQRQRYDVWGMCHTSQSWYGTSQERAEAWNRVSAKVGTHGAWGASGATGCTAHRHPQEKVGEQGVRS